MAHVRLLRKYKSLIKEDAREEVQTKWKKRVPSINRDLGFHRYLHKIYFWRGRRMIRLDNLGFGKV